ncbi:MAG: LamG domain-containing protein [Planctomycetaceae bacterium]|nr:LamG domain-containing protein [Planctomycetaceae bacterium]
MPTTNRGVRFSAERPATEDNAGGTFDGRRAHLAATGAALAELTRGEFTVSLWVNTDGATDEELGDLVSQFDAARRVGFELSLRTNAGVTSCQANARQLQFGIDAGTEPRWRDEGRPGEAVFAFALATHAGDLYAGTCEPARDAAGHVYRYQPDAPTNKWLDLGSPDKANAISALAEYRGQLYAGSAKYRLAGSALTESENPHDGGGIYRLDDNERWTEVGRFGPEQIAVGGLVVFQDRLYASSLYRPAGFFRYEEDGRWTSLPTPDGLRVESLGVHNGYLWASSYDGGYVFRFDGNAWKSLGVVGDNTQTYSFAVHRGQLHVGTWPSGRVFRLGDNDRWQDVGRLGEEREVMGMLVYNGALYGGTLPLAEVYRFDVPEAWTKVARLDHTPDVTYCRAWTMAQHEGRLFVSTLPSGQIHSLEAGKCATWDKAFPTGWRHVAAVRGRERLKLYVDGVLVAESTPFEARAFELPAQVPVLIGAGSGDFFSGRLRDVRVYARALSRDELAAAENR